MADPRDPTVAIIGAGPYGLSIAAHLGSAGVDYRVFGTPLNLWRSHMPRGMYLKSEGCASNLSAPRDGYSLRQYCADASLPYGDYAAPVPLETFTQYGLSFQQRLVPTVENELVTGLAKSSTAFELQLASGEAFRASKVVVATGVSHTAHIPTALTRLPSELRSHSGDHHDLNTFKERDVTVIGGGQSAIETAALLREAGAAVRLLVRRPSLLWNPVPNESPRSLYERLRRPMSNLGPGLGPWLYANAPMVFRHLPQQIRLAKVRTVLGPAGAWWLRDRVLDRLPIMPGYAVQKAETQGERVLLHLKGLNGELRQVVTEHVIAATGYRFALQSLPFLSRHLLAQLHSVQETPVLSRNFESSVPGLYFTGLASANQFGPAMRFLHGTSFTASQVSRHIARGRTSFSTTRDDVRRLDVAPPPLSP
jgi:hypothetical protein